MSAFFPGYPIIPITVSILALIGLYVLIAGHITSTPEAIVERRLRCIAGSAVLIVVLGAVVGSLK